MTDRAHLDFEWRSALDIRKVGLHRQMEHRSTSIWCGFWTLNDQRGLWRPGDEDPRPLLDHVARGGTVVSHNASAERIPWNNLLRKRVVPHWPELRTEQQSCTMARCSVLAIPASLEMAAIALNLPQRKDTDGGKGMKQMAKPRTRKLCGECLGSGVYTYGPSCDQSSVSCMFCDGCGELYTWWDDAERLRNLYAYCEQDVNTETGLDGKVPELSPPERRVWLLNQEINDRGVALDIPLIHRAVGIVEHAKKHLDAEMADLTSGFVKTCGSTKAIAAFLTARGVPCVSIAKDEQEDLLLQSDKVDDDVCREVIELRMQASKSSTAKLQTMLACVCSDGRARGLLFYHGASTGRESGRLIQPQNLYRTDAERDGADIARCVYIMQTAKTPADAYAIIEMIFGGAMLMLAKCMRSMFVAKHGTRFLGVDLANIEGRFAAWLAGEDWKIKAFNDYDAGTGADLYRIAYAASFGVDIASVTGAQRQIGKVEELSLQYQGSVGAFINMGKNYGLKPAKLVAPVRAAVTPEMWAETEALYAKAQNKHDLPIDQWTAIKLVVTGWRKGHPKIVQGWWDVQDAAIEAVSNPGHIVDCFDGKVRYVFARDFLWCALPNGRVLAYCRPQVRTTQSVTLIFKDGTTRDMALDEVADWKSVFGVEDIVHEELGRKKRQVFYEGYEGTAKRWTRFALYGGMQFNHIVQGGSRDVLFEGAFRAKDAGYPIVLDIHDELLNECPIGQGSPEELARLVSTENSWAKGLPLAAKAWEDVRYAK